VGSSSDGGAFTVFRIDAASIEQDEMGKKDTKPADKGSGSKGGKGKGKGEADEKETKSSKGAQSINVRHILVSTSSYSCLKICNGCRHMHNRCRMDGLTLVYSARSTPKRRRL
jgi:hypothetical protein